EIPSELPFKAHAAVRFNSQAKFNPVKFGAHLAAYLHKSKKCRIFEQTAAYGFENSHLVITKNCHRVKAESTAICTHYPFVNKNSRFYMKIFQSKSYAVAFPCPSPMRHMYIDCESSGLSFRGAKISGKSHMILTGQSHKSGHQNKDTHFDELLRKAKLYYGSLESAFQWSTQDCMTLDQIPFIGPLKSENKNVFFASGFKKWGMTHSMAAAEILSDYMISGIAENIDIFNPHRKNLLGQIKSFVVESFDAGVNILSGLVELPKHASSILKPGYGGIFRHNGEKVGAFMDKNEAVFVVKPFCTHMGCALRWNMEEQTWDCPCHGSRFDYAGTVLSGPALKNLECSVLKLPLRHMAAANSVPDNAPID
ncbi:MAG TPA: FAD-dependent oxidoreductase, partial [Ruminococcaceae bacterium]|nr:FAD-dependent oxidoreductase [Oscillospiraceae bacterium]